MKPARNILAGLFLFLSGASIGCFHGPTTDFVRTDSHYVVSRRTSPGRPLIEGIWSS